MFILAIINIVTIVIYYFPLSNNYDNLKMSYGAFQGISIISSIMLFYMLLFNSPIMRLPYFVNPFHLLFKGEIFFEMIFIFKLG